LLRTVKYGLYGAVLAGMVAGTAAWHGTDKTVELLVDGNPVVLHTTAHTVNDLLHAEGFTAGPHDLVAPAAASALHNGSNIVYRRGRLLALNVNGVKTDIWTTAPTVSQALEQLGYSTDDFSSVSRDRRLALAMTSLTVRTPRLVTVKLGKHSEQVSTTDSSVGELLADLGINLGPADRVSPPVGASLSRTRTIAITQVHSARVTAKTVVPYGTTTLPSSALASGSTQVVTKGHNGVAQVTYEVVYVDGKVVGKTPVKTVVVRPPISQVVQVGAAQPAAATAPTSAGTAQALGRQLAAQDGFGSDQFNCLVQLWDHESGWRTNAANPSGAYGIPQALPGWKMSSIGSDWRTSARTQITWGLGYISGRYDTPCQAWSFWTANDWY
jgi:uncharacterized protein YabE (DUF348 family)